MNYSRKVAKHLQIDISDLPVYISNKPGGHSDWDGCLIIYDDKNYPYQMELSCSLKKNAHGKRIIIHELLHFIMHKIDRHIIFGIIPFLEKPNKKKTTETIFRARREDFIWHLTEVFYRIIEYGIA
jgi:hypothetical protein